MQLRPFNSAELVMMLTALLSLNVEPHNHGMQDSLIAELQHAIAELA